MSDTVEKIYCTDNNDALLASVMGKNNNDPMAMAAMLNNNQWMNNPFIYLVFLMMFGRNGLWGNNANGVQNAEIQGQLNAIRNYNYYCVNHKPRKSNFLGFFIITI